MTLCVAIEIALARQSGAVKRPLCARLPASASLEWKTRALARRLPTEGVEGGYAGAEEAEHREEQLHVVRSGEALSNHTLPLSARRVWQALHRRRRAESKEERRCVE
jgi:hypothetical protein